MNKFFSAFLSVSLIFLPSGCAEGILDQNIPIAFEPVMNFQFFAVPVPGTKVMRSEAEWLEFCNNFWSESIKAPIPYIDFNQKIVLGIFWGDNCKYSGCTNASPSIYSVTKSSRQITVKVDPLADLGPCDMCVLPLYMATIPRMELPILFAGNLPD